jgi:hypothetical protein
MYRVTTPTHTFKLPIDTSDCAEIQLVGGIGFNYNLCKVYEQNKDVYLFRRE